jgi:hypothetical protein
MKIILLLLLLLGCCSFAEESLITAKLLAGIYVKGGYTVYKHPKTNETMLFLPYDPDSYYFDDDSIKASSRSIYRAVHPWHRITDITSTGVLIYLKDILFQFEPLFNKTTRLMKADPLCIHTDKWKELREELYVLDIKLDMGQRKPVPFYKKKKFTKHLKK